MNAEELTKEITDLAATLADVFSSTNDEKHRRAIIGIVSFETINILRNTNDTKTLKDVTTNLLKKIHS